MQGNAWDAVNLDHKILPLLNASQRDSLQDYNLLAKYMLGPVDDCQFCYRSQAALRVVTLPKFKWLKFLRGEDDGDADQTTIDGKCREIMVQCQEGNQTTVDQLKSLKGGPQRDALLQLYTEMGKLLVSWSANHSQ